MSIDVQASRDAGFEVEYMPAPPPDYAAILDKIYHVLRGLETVMSNRMVPDNLREVVYRSCIEGLTTYLQRDLGIHESRVGVILHAVDIQRAILNV